MTSILKNLYKQNPLIPKDHGHSPTDDGSFTFKSLMFNENCHSTAGAIEETLYNYIDGTGVSNLSEDKTTIFEVGLGLGMGPILSFIEASRQRKKLDFYSCEIQEDLIYWLKESVSEEVNEIFPFKSLKKINNDYWQATGVLGSLTVFVGDITSKQNLVLGLLQNKVHKIFQDPFSPKKNPSLWTTEWFQFLRMLASENCILSSYSASHGFRANLKNAGFTIHSKKGFGQKRSMTIAKI